MQNEFMDAISKALTTKNSEKLKAIYKKVPNGKCAGCTACCSESVNISFLEFSNIVKNGLLKLSGSQLEALKKRVISFYLLEWVKPQSCPYLDSDNRCLIYDVRPLPCRVFGTKTREAYEYNYKRIQRQNILAAKHIEMTYGTKVPNRVVLRKIDFCEAFIPERTLNKEAADELSSRLINMDGALYFEGLIDEDSMNGDLVNWTLDWFLGLETDFTIITKEWLYELKKDCLKTIQR